MKRTLATISVLALATSSVFGQAYPTQPVQTTPASGAPGTGPSTPSIATDDERAAFKAGREFVFTTGNNGAATQLGLPVAVNSVLNARICNNGAKPWYIAAFGRFFDTTSAVDTAYFGAANPDALTAAQAATLTGCGAAAPNTCNLSYGTNLLPGAPAQTDVSMSFGVGSVMTCGGTACVPSGNGIIYSSVKNEISKPRVLPPGKCFGQTAVGQNNQNGLGQSAASFIFRVYIYSDQ